MELLDKVQSQKQPGDVAAVAPSKVEATPTPHPQPEAPHEPKLAPAKEETAPDAFEEAYEKEQAAYEEESDSWYDMPPTLYIGCIPRPNGGNRHVVGKMVWLEDFLKSYQDRVAENRSVSHYSLIEYAKGEKEVAALVHHDIRNELGMPLIMIADRRMAGSSAVLEVLVQHYQNIVERLG